MSSDPQKKTGKQPRTAGRGKAAVAKTPPRKKSGGRKKKQARLPLLPAFIAGALVASAIFMALSLAPDFDAFVADLGRRLTMPELAAKKTTRAQSQNPGCKRTIPRERQRGKAPQRHNHRP